MRERLLAGKSHVVMHGGGYIGLTNAMSFAQAGVKAVVYDPVEWIVDKCHRGECHLVGVESFMQAKLADYVREGLITATANPSDTIIRSGLVHFIGVPTERDNEPWFEPLCTCLRLLKEINPSLIIVESTLTPGVLPSILQDLSMESHPIGTSPRRDWFISPEKTLKVLPRVYGADTKEIADAMQAVLSIVCDKLVRASSREVAIMVKSVENMLLHVPIMVANELTHAYPHIPIREVLQLASTHWRIPLYFPSMKVAGYCIGLSSKYVYDGAAHPEELSIINATIKCNSEEPWFYPRKIAEVLGRDVSVAILGVSYHADLKMHVNTVVKEICETFPNVKIHDPYYSDAEVCQFFGKETLDPADLSEFSAIFILVHHKAFTRMTPGVLSTIQSGTVVIDNLGAWERHRDFFASCSVRYYRIGDPIAILQECHKWPRTMK